MYMTKNLMHKSPLGARLCEITTVWMTVNCLCVKVKVLLVSSSRLSLFMVKDSACSLQTVFTKAGKRQVHHCCPRGAGDK